MCQLHSPPQSDTIHKPLWTITAYLCVFKKCDNINDSTKRNERTLSLSQAFSLLINGIYRLKQQNVWVKLTSHRVSVETQFVDYILRDVCFDALAELGLTLSLLQQVVELLWIKL